MGAEAGLSEGGSDDFKSGIVFQEKRSKTNIITSDRQDIQDKNKYNSLVIKTIIAMIFQVLIFQILTSNFLFLACIIWNMHR